MTEIINPLIQISPFAAAFMVGLLGAGHCVGMCGGITSALVFSLPASVRGNWRRTLPYLLSYNAGRILSYSIAGMLVAGVGMLAGNLLPVQQTQQALLVIAALFMIAMGLYLGGWWNGLLKLEKAGGWLWNRIRPVAQKLMPVASPAQAFVMGLVWGWLPCGLVYSVLIWALAAGSVLKGGLLLASFGLGTLPTLLLTGSAAGFLARRIQSKRVRQFSGFLILAFGVALLLGALGVL